MLVRFVATLFLSASLLFCVEPMVARMIMPLFGGAPAVWITCMLFFQAALLGGYVYAHASIALLGVRRHAVVHAALFVVPLAVLPLHFSEAQSRAVEEGAHPVLALLWLLVAAVGIPFFAISTGAPVLQKWFSAIGHPSGKDPYFLYAASNLGSMVALAAYPALVEPFLGLGDQTRLWTYGYVGLAVLVATCAVAVLRAPKSAGSAPDSAAQDPVAPSLTNGRRVRWIALAFVPSSLLLGVTTYVTTDIAPIPLFWVLPLALYLATFTLVFAKRPPVPHALMVRLLPLGATAAMITLLTESATPGWFLILVHLLTLFLASMVAHGELAKDRPDAAHLTEFYIWLSVGGVLGGVFNALVAPAIFSGVIEYPLAIVVACLCRRPASVTASPGSPQRALAVDIVVALAIGLVAATLIIAGRALHLEAGGLAFKGLIGAPLFFNYKFLDRPRRFALGIAATLAASALYPGASGRTIVAMRNFFGVVRVTHDPGERFVQLAHGNTIHGRQSLDPEKRGVPLLYYHPTGPIGQVFSVVNHGSDRAPARVGAIGLGVGTMACYRAPGQKWVFYEINPAVVAIARDPRYFTYLSDHFDSPDSLAIDVGDARLRLRAAPDHGFGLLVLDAFSSDAIPAHLLTREAFALYLQKLDERGIVAAHISNRYLDLAPVFGALARDADLVALMRSDTEVPAALIDEGKRESQWVVLARHEQDLGELASDTRWVRLGNGGARVWTDDFSNLMGVYRW